MTKTNPNKGYNGEKHEFAVAEEKNVVVLCSRTFVGCKNLEIRPI